MVETVGIVRGAGMLALIASLLSWAALQDRYVRYFLEIGAVGFLC